MPGLLTHVSQQELIHIRFVFLMVGQINVDIPQMLINTDLIW